MSNADEVVATTEEPVTPADHAAAEDPIVADDGLEVEAAA